MGLNSIGLVSLEEEKVHTELPIFTHAVTYINTYTQEKPCEYIIIKVAYIHKPGRETPRNQG